MTRFFCGVAVTVAVELALWLIIVLPVRGEDFAHSVAYSISICALCATVTFLLALGLAPEKKP